MDEGRKRTLGVIAAIFVCRKLNVLEKNRRQRGRWRKAGIS